MDVNGKIVTSNINAQVALNKRSGDLCDSYFSKLLETNEQLRFDNLYRQIVDQILEEKDSSIKQKLRFSSPKNEKRIYEILFEILTTRDANFVLTRFSLENKNVELGTQFITHSNQDISQSMTEGFLIQDARGKMIYLNPAFANMIGYSVDELIGHHWTYIVPKEDIKKVAKADKRRTQGIADRYELRILRKDGRKIFVLINGKPLFENNKYIGTQAVCSDITDIKRTELIHGFLHRLYQAIHQTKDMMELYRSIQDELSKILDTTNFIIALYNSDRDELTFPYFKDEKDEIVTAAAGKSFSAYVIKTREALFLNEKGIDDLNKSGKAIMAGTTPKIWMGLPL